MSALSEAWEGLPSVARHAGGVAVQSGGPSAEGGAAAPAVGLPCLFVTTACKQDESPPLPGPRKKQAQALTDNIQWLAETFGPERIGFVTLTVGDKDVAGRFRNLRDRKEVQRRFHSLMSNEISRHFICGVTVIERHMKGGLHFHLVVLCKENIRGNIDFAACFPPKDFYGKPTYKANYATANAALKREWVYFQRITKLYGFGRHQVQPMRESAEALGRYVGAYLQKDWMFRLAEDKGARCVRYFGHWSKEDRKEGDRPKAPPTDSKFGWLTPRARAWREMVRQVVTELNHKGVQITENSIKTHLGRRWAWKMHKLLEGMRFETDGLQEETLRKEIEEHNFKVETRWLLSGGNPSRDCLLPVGEIRLEHFRPAMRRARLKIELLLIKEGQGDIKPLPQCRKLKLETLKEAATEYGWISDPNVPF